MAWNRVQAANDLERFLLRGEKPAIGAVELAVSELRNEGRTCKLAEVHDWDDEWEPFGYECESCGEGLPRCYGSDKFGMVTIPNYCPNCGAKVVKE